METSEEVKTEVKTEMLSVETPVVDVKIESPKQEVAKRAEPIELSRHGEIMAKDNSQLMRVIHQLFKSEALPSWYKTVDQVLLCWNLAASLGLKPQPALGNICMINGAPYLFGDLPRTLAEMTGELESCLVFVCDAEYNEIKFENKNLNAEPLSGVCVIKRKGRETRSYSFTVEQAKDAGLWMKTSRDGKPSPWVLYPETMLMRRAMAMALKFEFADALKGSAIAEYDANVLPEKMKDVTPSVNLADELNTKFMGAANEH